MERKKPDLESIPVATRIIVHRSEISTTALGEIIQKGEFLPSEGEVCELEAGGQVIARGRIVRRRGVSCFKLLEKAKEERS
jgi:hypothetical protein